MFMNVPSFSVKYTIIFIYKYKYLYIYKTLEIKEVCVKNIRFIFFEVVTRFLMLN